MSKKRVLLLVGDFVEDYEVMFAQQMLEMVGHDFDAVCPDKKTGEYVTTSVHDFEGHQTYSEKRGHNFRLNATFADINEGRYDGLIIPGGRAPEYLRLNPRVLAIVRHFFETKKPVLAICHGPQLLAAAGVMEGRTCMAYPALQPDIVAVGGRWAEPDPALAGVHVDGNLVSGPAWPANPSCFREFLRLLGTPVGV